jgi:hypothetical protein
MLSFKPETIEVSPESDESRIARAQLSIARLPDPAAVGYWLFRLVEERFTEDKTPPKQVLHSRFVECNESQRSERTSFRSFSTKAFPR